ncbi:hypothetical protein AMECASPLE_007463 [Ameca splendens]|uniref:Uncharacterized protein n=1 Tax=Ameca splendens TaxID=208324 RepID=A0ABV0YXS0_9TELE
MQIWTTGSWCQQNSEALQDWVRRTEKTRMVRADYLLRKLRSFSVCSKMLHIFYKSVVESVISSAIIC